MRRRWRPNSVSEEPFGALFSDDPDDGGPSAIVEMWKTPRAPEPQVIHMEPRSCPEVINILIHNKLGYFEVKPQSLVCRSCGENGVSCTVRGLLRFVDKGLRGYNFKQLISCIRLQ